MVLNKFAPRIFIIIGIIFFLNKLNWIWIEEEGSHRLYVPKLQA